jgi:lysozyme
MYPGFGIELPVDYDIHGIDISIFQQTVYWPAIKKMQVKDVKVGFVFIKATEGLLNTDRQFKRNWQKAKEAHIPRGAYHFFLATKDGKAQANNFIKRVKLEPGDLPPVLDIEQLYGVPPALMRQRVKTWLQAVEAAYDVKPIIYSSADFYNRYLGKDFDDYPLWVAHYFEQKQPRVEREWQFWQHSSIGHMNGITSNVDFNVFNGDSAAFKEMLLK